MNKTLNTTNENTQKFDHNKYNHLCYMCVLDFEATCWNESDKSNNNILLEKVTQKNKNMTLQYMY